MRFLLYKEMCQHLANLHYSMNQYFYHYNVNVIMLMLKNHAWVKESFKMQVNEIILINRS